MRERRKRWEAIRTFTQQDPATVFVEANALIVRLQEENRQLRADLAQARSRRWRDVAGST